MELTEQNFKAEVEDYAGLALVDFFAPWCGPCQLMSPIIDQLAQDYHGKAIKIVKVNIDENKQISDKYQIISIPSLYLFKQGKIIERVNGYSTPEELKKLIDKYLPNDKSTEL